jgi:hypothetical protein
MTDFRDAPVSLGERRALNEDNCSRWTPRELLMHLLREMDSGKFNPDALVVCYLKVEDAGTRTGMRRAKASVMQTIALLEVEKHDLLGG